jgi:hypothetical protein
MESKGRKTPHDDERCNVPARAITWTCHEDAGENHTIRLVPHRRAGGLRRRRTASRHVLRRHRWRQLIRLLLAEHFFYGGHDPIRLEPELVLQFFERSGRTERLHTDDATGIADVPLPSKGRRLFDGEARFYARRQNAVPVFLRLVLEDVPRWH